MPPSLRWHFQAECVLPEEELKRRGTEEQGGEGGGRGNVLGQNLKNGGGRRFGERRAGGEAGSSSIEVTGGTEFPSYPPLTPRTGSGRDPGELHCNYLTNIIIEKTYSVIPSFAPIFIHLFALLASVFIHSPQPFHLIFHTLPSVYYVLVGASSNLDISSSLRTNKMSLLQLLDLQSGATRRACKK